MAWFLHDECVNTDFPSRVLIERFWASLMQVPCVACSDRLVMQASGSCCWIIRVARSQSHPAAANCLKWPTSEKGYSGSQKTAGKLAGAGIRTETVDENVGEIWSRVAEEAGTMHSKFFFILILGHTGLVEDTHHYFWAQLSINYTIIAKCNQLSGVRGV